MEKEEWAEAARKVQAAFQLRPSEPQVWLVQARLLTRLGRSMEALQWWQRIVQSRQITLDDRRDYAAAALAAHELTIASEQVELLMRQRDGPTPKDLLLAAGLAGLRGYTVSALDYASRVLADQRSNTREKLNAAAAILSEAPPKSELYLSAERQMISIARSGSDLDSLEALTVLARRATAASTPNNAGNKVESEMTLPEIADRLDSHPKARPFHRLLALSIRAQADPARSETLIADAVRMFGQGDDETLTILSAWLYTRGQFEAVLKILPPERATRTRELFIQRIDALGALHRYEELEQTVQAEQSVLDQTIQHMFLAVAKAKLGEAVASDNEWKRALAEADNLQKLLMLADYAEKNGAFEIADTACARVIEKQTGFRPAYTARLRLNEALERTDKAHAIALEIVRIWPEDMAMHVHEIYLRLLLDPSAATAKLAEEEAEKIAAKIPWDKPSQTALALARLRQGRMAAALEAAPQPGPGVPASPVLAAAWAANGWKNKAKEEMQKLATKKLLPEERKLIAPLLEQ